MPIRRRRENRRQDLADLGRNGGEKDKYEEREKGITKSIPRGATCARRLVVVRASRDRTPGYRSRDIAFSWGRPPSPRHVSARDAKERIGDRSLDDDGMFVGRDTRRTCVPRRGEPRKNPAEKLRFRGPRDDGWHDTRGQDRSTPEVAFTEVPSTERRAVRTRANDYHRGKPRVDRHFTTDFTLYRRDTIKKRNPRFCAEERRRTSRLASENVVWRAGAC